jgi:arylsulfatase A-like enzyme
MAVVTKPNIVFVLCDNVGWGDFGVYGGGTPTPRIDQLADEYRVGQVIDCIEQAGITDNTLIVFSSDNAAGGTHAFQGGSNGPSADRS